MARLPYLIPYDPGFLGDGFQVPLPTPSCQGRLVQSGRVYDYIHFSLIQHRDRRSALVTAHNIDVSQKRSASRTGWDLDSRIDRLAQTGQEAYANNPWDRGHLVRRDAVVWGSRQEAQDASDSTFYFTNAALQHAKFNQDEWLSLEDWVLRSAGNITPRLCVFTGPIYTSKDQFERGFRIPSAFWKMVVLRDPTADGDDLSTLGFMMKQNELWDDWNGAQTLDLRLYQVGVAEIGRYAGLEFGELTILDEFEWRQARFRDRSHMAPVPIEKFEDIRFFGDQRRARGLRALRLGGRGNGDGGTAVSLAKGSHPCGCSERKASLEEQVQVLGHQVETLREIVETLLEEQQEGAGRASRGLRRMRDLFARIVGGHMTASGDFPECACIGDDGQPEWFCSGVLIHERVVLTAAHCAPSISKVYLNGRSVNLAGVQGEVVEVESVLVHPDYDPNRVPSHDIAVLILKNPATTPAVDVATRDEVDAEDNVTLVGFGFEHPSLPVGFGTKRQVDVPLTQVQGLDEIVVQRLETLHGYDANFELHAGRKELGKDSCNGDSGGPAYIGQGGGRKLAGVTSRAAFSSELPCGDGGIYTRITPYLDWIETATGGLVSSGSGGGGSETPATPTSRLYISAAMPNPPGPDGGREWIEITNGSTSDASLNGYSLADRQGGRHALSGLLSPRSSRREEVPGTSQLKLGNGGDDIVLLRGDEEIHRVSYLSAGSGETFRFEPPAGQAGSGDDLPPGHCEKDGETTDWKDADPC